MTHPFAAHVAGLARALPGRGTAGKRLGPSTDFIPHVFLAWDAQGGRIEVEDLDTEGALLDLRIRTGGEPAWFSLGIGLGTGALQEGDVLVVALAIRSEAELSLPMFLRARPAGGKALDTPLADPLEPRPDTGHALVLHRIGQHDQGPKMQGYHSLNLRLPARDMRLTLRGLSCSVLPAILGVQTRQPDMADAFAGSPPA